MKEVKILNALGQIDEKYIVEAMPGNALNSNKKWLRWCAVAACLVLIIGIFRMEYGSRMLYFNFFDRIVVTYLDDTDIKNKVSYDAACLINLTEEQIFHEQDTDIFFGEVIKIDNIEIQEMGLNGWSDYRAVLHIKVKENYRGTCKVGDVVTVLIPCHVATVQDNISVDSNKTNTMNKTNSDYLKHIQTGTEGIFMPVQYTDDVLEVGDTQIILKKIAQYGIWDYRYVFWDNGRNISFDRDTFESIKNANSMDEIKAYILDMVKK